MTHRHLRGSLSVPSVKGGGGEDGMEGLRLGILFQDGCVLQRGKPVLGVPVGVIGCNRGGTSASAWMDEKHMEEAPPDVYLKEYEQAVKDKDPEGPIRLEKEAYATEDSPEHQRGWTGTGKNIPNCAVPPEAHLRSDLGGPGYVRGIKEKEHGTRKRTEPAPAGRLSYVPPGKSVVRRTLDNECGRRGA